MRKLTNPWSRGVVTGALLLLALPMLTECKTLPGGAAPNLGGLNPGGSCPQSFDDIANANFGIDASLESRVKASLTAALSLKEIAGKLDADVTAACGTLAKDLGATDADLGKGPDGACNAAVKFLGEVKAKAKGKIEVKAKEPRCAASMDAMADCAGKCDASVKPGSANVTCEGGKLSGSCDAECKGTCSVEAGASCEGSCHGDCTGSCEAGFSGKCGGKCDGKCDGKNTKGKCAGTCEGKCDASASGTCSGECKGSCSATCDVNAKGKCSGTCTGECSVQMKAPKCTGEVKPPQMSADCKASCDAKVSAELTCTPPMVEVTVAGSADAEAATKLRAVLSKDLPALLEVTMGMKSSAEKAVAGVKTTVEGVQAVIKSNASAALKVGPCIAAAIQAQVEASASIDVSIHASASASASASGGTG